MAIPTAICMSEKMYRLKSEGSDHELLCDAAAAGVCKWATHLQFRLTPFAQEVGNMRPHQADPSGSNEWVPDHLKAIHATHHAVAMSALSAIGHIATLDPSRKRQREQATCNTDASWLQQQLSSWSVPVPQLQQQAPPQPGLDSTHQHADPSRGTSAADSGAPTSVLQVNVREVLGCGSTGIIFAGKSTMLCAWTNCSSSAGLQANF